MEDERSTRTNQRNQLLELLRANEPHWVPIRDVLEVAGYQYGARVFELRRLAHRIENDPGRAFRLVTTTPSLPSTSAPPPAATSDRLFPDDAPPRHLDLG